MFKRFCDGCEISSRKLTVFGARQRGSCARSWDGKLASPLTVRRVKATEVRSSLNKVSPADNGDSVCGSVARGLLRSTHPYIQVSLRSEERSQPSIIMPPIVEAKQPADT